MLTVTSFQTSSVTVSQYSVAVGTTLDVWTCHITDLFITFWGSLMRFCYLFCLVIESNHKFMIYRFIDTVTGTYIYCVYFVLFNFSYFRMCFKLSTKYSLGPQKL